MYVWGCWHIKLTWVSMLACVLRMGSRYLDRIAFFYTQGNDMDGSNVIRAITSSKSLRGMMNQVDDVHTRRMCESRVHEAAREI